MRRKQAGATAGPIIRSADDVLLMSAGSRTRQRQDEAVNRRVGESENR